MSSDDIRDGFSSNDVEATLQPSRDAWISQVDYEEVTIAALNTGPLRISIMGRIVNFFDQPATSKMPQAAKGCVKMIVKDNTGAITVPLSFMKGHLLPHSKDSRCVCGTQTATTNFNSADSSPSGHPMSLQAGP